MKLKKQDGGAMLPSNHPKITLLKEYKEIKSQKSSKLLYDYELKYNESEDHSKGSVIMESSKFVTHQDLEILSQRVDHGQELINKDLSQFKDQIVDIKNDSKQQHEALMKSIEDKFENIKDLQKSQFDTQSAEVKNYISSAIFKATTIGIAVATLIITIAIFVLDKFVLNS